MTGDSEAEADLVEAAEDARNEGALRLNALVPGWSGPSERRVLGGDVPVRTTVSDPTFFDGIEAAVDRFLITGDLGDRRGAIVDGTSHQSSEIPPDMGTPRSTPAAARQIDPYPGASELLRGNTLVLNDAQARVSDRVLDLCDDLVMVLRAHAQANVYLSVGDAPGFGSHWDDHDVLVVPVTGAKYWTVEEPAALAPIKDVIPSGGTGRTVWSGVLGRGDALAIPRGWPHFVRAIGDEASLHLTFSIRRPTALDLFAQIESAAVIDGHVDRALLEHALGSWRSMLTHQPRRGPLRALVDRQRSYRGRTLRVRLPGGVVFLPEEATEDRVVLAANNRTIDVARRRLPVLAALVRRSWQLDELAATTDTMTDDLVEFIEDLDAAGILHLEAA